MKSKQNNSIKQLTKVFILSITCFIATSAKAQWALTGNSTSAPNNVLGTTNATDLDIRTNNLSRLYIKQNNGFIGIGNANPVFLLDIVNSGNASMSFKSTTGNANILIDRGATTGSSSVQYRTAGSTQWQTGNLPGNTDYAINNASLSTTAMTVLKSNNNVGIGTATPVSKLVVSGNESTSNGKEAAIQLSNVAAGGKNWYIRAGATGTGTPKGGLSIADDIAYRMAIDTNGNVGINTLAPVTRLSNTSTDIISNDGLGVGSGSIGWSITSVGYITSLYNASSSSTAQGLAVKIRGTGSTNRLLDLSTGVSQTGAAASVMVVQGNGNVGIGTPTPGDRLSVLSADNNDATDIATFISNDGTQGVSIGRNTIRAAGSNANVDLFLKSKGTNSVQFHTNATNQVQINGSGDLEIFGNNNGTSSVGFLRFGFAAGQGIASKRTAGGNQNGLDFYTANINRMAITTTGNIGVNTSSPSSLLELRRGALGISCDNKRWEINYDSTNAYFYIDEFGAGRRFIIANGGNVGISTSSPTSTLSVNGSADKPGGGSWAVFSDSRLKQDITEYNDGLSILKKISPVKYHYNELSGCDTKPEYVGVIAQELQKVAPYMVSTFKKNGTDYLKVDNSAMTYMLINAVKEQQTQIETKDDAIKSLQSTVGSLQNDNAEMKKDNAAMKDRLNAFENALSQCCTNFKSTQTENVNQNNSTSDKATLEQNIPNPFTQGTVIRFYIPQSSGTAVLKIYTLDGTELKSFAVNQKGYGEITIEGNTLAAGVYAYTLIIDKKAIDSKQMILTK